ncbi:P38.7 [Pseudalatia unipuncta granulovirus]|uniref:P38.7 n=1 Tax=Pseudalatia unipuncta granulosis virus TaxID=36355 RepID=B6S6V3_GVPU|nr:P38.7 [Pseudalatia unipuncta granulovirus]ACH69434.1 P38.7 [Pseudalatia unipuncta granulovirus]
MDVLKTIKNWWWGGETYSNPVEFYLLYLCKKLDKIDTKIDVLDKKTNCYLHNRWPSTSTSLSTEDEDVKSSENHHDEEKENNSVLPDELPDEYDTDGSNLAVYSKNSINDTTRLQYVTGHRDAFQTRKRMYDGVVMEKLYEANNLEEPAAKIAKLEEEIINSGKRIEYAGQHGTVVYANEGEVRDIINKTMK